MKNLFSKCGKLRRRLRKHSLTTKAASNYGAFHTDDSVSCESYKRTKSSDGCSESTERDITSKRDILSTTAAYETGFNPGKGIDLDPDDTMSETAKELTNELKENIISLLNFLYAEEFAEDVLLLEITIILFARKGSFELQEKKEGVSDQDENANELQAWIDIMSKKIYGGETRKVIAWQSRIPGPVGKPVIGGCTMQKMASKLTIKSAYRS